jgi:adenosine deaminase
MAALAALLAAAMLLPLGGCTEGAQRNEGEVARYFEKAKENEAELIALLQDMPKGADLHNHSSGTIEAELVLQAAIDGGLYFDRASKTFVEERPKGGADAYFDAEQMQASGDGSGLMRSEILDALSMRESDLEASGGESGHDRFFSFWERTGAAYPSQADIYRSLFRRAVVDRVGYLELMDNVEAADVAEIDGVLDEVLAEFAADGLEWGLEVNFITTVSRNQPLGGFKSSLDEALAAQYEPSLRIVGTTILSPEDSYISQRDFEAQMQAIDEAYARLSAERGAPPRLSLHAGELTLEYATYESMFDRVSTSIERGHASRIDHGTSIAWNLDTYGLLQRMRDEGIGVTVCLSSNDAILGLSGDRHPFELYRAAGVPVALATDDMGIERTNLTYEHVRAAREFDLGYYDLKELAYDSIKMALATDESKAAMKLALDERFKAYEDRTAQAIKTFKW